MADHGADGRAARGWPRTQGEAQAVPEATPRAAEPVWLVRIVFLLFLVGFAMFLGREAYLFLEALR